MRSYSNQKAGDSLLPRQPYFKRHEFVGTLRHGGTVVEGLQIVTLLSRCGEGQIRALIVGDGSTHKRLQPLLFRRSGFLTVEGPVSVDGRITIRSRSASLSSLQTPSTPECVDGRATYVVAKLNLHDCEETVNYEGTHDRSITFLLRGAESLWQNYYSSEYSYDGTIGIEVDNKTFALDPEIPLAASVEPHFIVETEAEDDELRRRRFLSVSFAPKDDHSTISDQEFRKLAISIADDLCLLASFASRNWCEWFQYHFAGTSSHQSYYRSLRRDSSMHDDSLYHVVEHAYGRRFLESSLPVYRRLCAEGHNLLVPITQIVTAHQAEYISSQFALYAMAAERLKNEFGAKVCAVSNLGASEFRKLLEVLKAVIDREMGNIEAASQIKERLAELNRPTFARVLQRLLEHYNVEWKDLYPEQAKLTVIKARNAVIHALEHDDTDLFKECERLQIILERLLLRILQWEDVDQVAKEHDLRYLSDPTRRSFAVPKPTDYD